MLLSTHGIDGKVVLFEEGLDPADMVFRGEISKLQNTFKGGSNLIEFTIEKIIESYDIKNPYQKEKAFNEVKSYLLKFSEIIRDEFIPFASSLLGVSPELFNPTKFKKSQPKKEPIAPIKDNRCYDIGVLNILKTLIEKPEMVKLLKKVDTNYLFNRHLDLYKSILENSKNPKIIELSLDECYKILNDNEFKNEICNLLIIKYQTFLKEIIHNKDISYEKKQYIMRKIRTEIIPSLRKGEILDPNLLD